MSSFHKRIKGPVYKLLTILFPDDEKYLKFSFRMKMGYKLDLNNPKTFNEKLQWLKLHNRHAKYTQMVDKYAVKDFVSNMIGEEYIIPTLGVWDRFEDIDFDKLPSQFVLKCTHDSGGLVICKDKSALNKNDARKTINSSLKKNFYWEGREYPYKDVKPRIIAEKYMVDESGTELKDYKFFCFNGEPKFFKVDFDRSTVHHANYFDLKWNFLKFGEVVCPYVESRKIDQPLNFDNMIEIARKLSANIPFVRIDLYNIKGQIYFGEMTFFPTSGFGPFYPKEWDYKIGQWLKLPNLDSNE
jgi:hypothetical protein